jgi:hypothetical protein
MVVWSKNSSTLVVSKKRKFFNADEFIEGTGQLSVLTYSGVPSLAERCMRVRGEGIVWRTRLILVKAG